MAVVRELHSIDPAGIAAAEGDAFGGRRTGGGIANLVLQTADGLPLYLALTPPDVRDAARALASAWRTLGVRRHDTVLICDYGTSPITLFASWCFAPFLERGAADLLGAVPICNDGLPEFAGRALHVLRYLRPRVTIIDRAQMPAFISRAAEASVDIASLTELVAVSTDEEPVTPAERTAWGRKLGLPVRLLLRSGAALFFAAECGAGLLHVDSRFYAVETIGPEGEPAGEGEGTLCISNRFLRGIEVDHHLSNIRASLAPGRCSCGRAGRVMRYLP